ncbi:hypothetical protein [Silvibacterium acidisoli]|uniref:hypothetical protein n=1 Tax=Acidobacteriaceae bacterium ZG23-2 TaxID=2883246 RepID=UPI00406C1A83
MAVFVAAAEAQQPSGGAGAEQLMDAARQAHDAGDLQKEAEDICRAAGINPKYAKRCDKAKDSLAKAMAQFEADYNQAVSEAQHRDFPGAIRDFSKITSGPRHEAAQAFLPQMRVLGHMGTDDELSHTAMRLASFFYSGGKLEEAESWLKFVTVSSLQSAKTQMQTNIRVYRQTMQQAGLLMGQHNWTGAMQQLQFAMQILPSGPGDPQGQLKQAQAQIAAGEQAAQQQANAQAAALKAANDAKIQSLLAAGSKDEARGDTAGAVKAYTAVLAIDPAQATALAGRKRALSKPMNDPKALEALLDDGVTQFYASQYIEADESLNAYLSRGGRIHAGAAHFYLGAALTAQQLLADPKDAPHIDDLQQQARKQFEEARKLNFQPLEAAVSPRILDQWSQTGAAQ